MTGTKSPPTAVRDRVIRFVGTTFGVAMFLGLMSCSSSQATRGISVTDAKIPAPASTDVAAAYFTVKNNSSAADVLQSVTTDAGKQAEVHRDVSTGGVDSMKPTGPITIAAHSSVTLVPGDRHLMITNLTRSLKQGDHVSMTLHFTHAGDVTVSVPVVSATAVIDSGMANMPGMSDSGSVSPTTAMSGMPGMSGN